jgi:putative ABC transport system ATP-binding protein
METSLFAFIWKHSKRQQLGLLALTLVTFPFIFLSLELPKRIINDVIAAPDSTAEPWTRGLSQEDYLIALCLAFLASVLVAGLLKMGLNIRKGILSERMLRRLRYVLITRMMRFPAPYFRSSSQGEMVAMISSESEPMGGLMGDAVAQPVFLAGQMLTIVTFLFLQSFWFGVVSVALIPLQAWLIPSMQRRINRMNKDRIRELRRLASEIGETAGGLSDLRANGGLRFRRALISDRLGRLFTIRKRIYITKFFMKFLNNLITQVTPFIFYLAGGLLAIRGDLSIGALVAALAAYKDLSSPWRELLVYYNLVQDMSARWKIMAERFDPPGMLPEALSEGAPETIPHLRGDVVFDRVTVLDGDGQPVLEDLTFTIPQGARAAVQCSSAAERAAIARLLTREALPASGSVTAAGHSLAHLHQAVIAARIGHAHSRPHLFDGTLGGNVMMPLNAEPAGIAAPRALYEALRSGNTADSPAGGWVNPAIEADEAELRDWWFRLAGAMGMGGRLFRRVLHGMADPAAHPELAAGIVALRPAIRARLEAEGLSPAVLPLEAGRYNPALPLAENLLFALPAEPFTAAELAAGSGVQAALAAAGLSDTAFEAGLAVADRLRQTFGRDGPAHPLFSRLGLDPAGYDALCALAGRYTRPDAPPPSEQDRAAVIAVLFQLSEVQAGAALPGSFKEAVAGAQIASGADWRAVAGARFEHLSDDAFMPQLTLLENALLAKTAVGGEDLRRIEELVMEELDAAGLRRALSVTLYDLPAGPGGAKLAPVLQERAALSRAAIKQPDILVMDQVLASQDEDSRRALRRNLKGLMPKATLIFLEEHFAAPETYDLHLVVEGGRLSGTAPSEAEVSADGFDEKLAAVTAADLLQGIGRRNQRLLAFSGEWHDLADGDHLFRLGQPGEAVFLCQSGTLELSWPRGGANGDAARGRAAVSAGQITGELAAILRAPYRADCRAAGPARVLRIRAEDFLAVIQSDPRAALRLLEQTAGQLALAADAVQAQGLGLADEPRGAHAG